MGLFSGLARAAAAALVLPVDVVADVVTLGGTNTGKETTYTGKRARDIMRALDEATGGDD